MLAEREANSDQIGVVINSPYHMRTYIGPAAAGAAPGDTDIVHIKIHEYHF